MNIRQPSLSHLALASLTLSAGLSAFIRPSLAADPEKVFPEVRAAESKSELKPHVGIQVGYLNPKGAPEGNVAAAIDVGVQPIVPFSLGLQVQYSPSEVNVGNQSFNFDTINTLVKAAYNFGGDVPVLKSTQIGLRTGATFYKGENDTVTKFAVGPFIAMDFPIDENKKFSVGPEIGYLGVIGDNSPDQFSASGAMKFWF